jgi:hypothetical protein
MSVQDILRPAPGRPVDATVAFMWKMWNSTGTVRSEPQSANRGSGLVTSTLGRSDLRPARWGGWGSGRGIDPTNCE